MADLTVDQADETSTRGPHPCPHGRLSFTWCLPCQKIQGAVQRVQRRGFASGQARHEDTRPIVASYSGRCSFCGGTFSEGTMIRRGRDGWEHETCP